MGLITSTAAGISGVGNDKVGSDTCTGTPASRNVAGTAMTIVSTKCPVSLCVSCLSGYRNIPGRLGTAATDTAPRTSTKDDSATLSLVADERITTSRFLEEHNDLIIARTARAAHLEPDYRLVA
jgi:hypothetical protein